MKQQFSKLVLEQDFKNAVDLMISEILNVKVPKDDNLTFQFNNESYVENLLNQVENYYGMMIQQYDNSLSKIWNETVNNPEYLKKENLKINKDILNEVSTKMDIELKQLQTNQLEQLFEFTVIAGKASLQAIVDTAVLMNKNN